MKGVHKIFDEVFTGLTLLDCKKRMSVHEARVKVQCIKLFLPTIGEDYDCPSIEAIIREQRKKYGGSVGTIEGMRRDVAGIEHEEGWDQSHSSFHSALGYGFSENCSMYLGEDDHLVCNEPYPGRYAAECENGYYYDEASYLCVEDTLSQCPSISDEYHMCILYEGDSTPSLGCRSTWYGDDCDQLFEVHIPDKLFRSMICNRAWYLETDCDISEYKMAYINDGNVDFGLISSYVGTEYLINEYYASDVNTYATSCKPFSSLSQLSYLIMGYADNPILSDESDDDYFSFIMSVFPIHDRETQYKTDFFLPNNCPINSDPGNTPFNCDPESESECPSIVLNEVYNSVDGVNEKQCAFIAKEGTNGECYTVHDDTIREFLKFNCLSMTEESNGIISVGTMRSNLTCSSLSLCDILSRSSSSISTVNDITTLQGLEYAQGIESNGKHVGLTSLNIDGYDLSGDINQNAEYDKLVVQILAKAVTYSNSYGSINSGLTSLSVIGCGLSAINEILDFTPIVNGDFATQPFKLTHLYISNNNITDISVLITSSMFPEDVLTTLDISGNSICDINSVVTSFRSYFTNPNFAIVSSNQSKCPCQGSVSFSSHKTCRLRSDGFYQVECWNGYYLDKSNNECIKACPINESLDPNDDEKCIQNNDVNEDNVIHCTVCEKKVDLTSVLNDGDLYVSCGCSYGWYGDSCSSDICSYDSQCKPNEVCNQASGQCECDDKSYLASDGECIFGKKPRPNLWWIILVSIIGVGLIVGGVIVYFKCFRGKINGSAVDELGVRQSLLDGQQTTGKDDQKGSV
ncbi:hypothetical protein ADUPG1_008778 [Aduncisulcus paluster]|uniref:EGF-like domain-containing protein n=1 Tax=Aduncisulcus paluster TaxID=2918883 RepID=A0ABQ5KT79_9EUKA|nr:hypothetical protein ADUPG1_008778 [Aduncisulcus paluster]